ncbi:MAG: hypothetical protein ACOYNL_08840 [Rickettsiales bacterium]
MAPVDAYALTKQERISAAKAKRAGQQQPSNQQPIVIVLPREGATKTLVDGYTIDAGGVIKNSSSQTVATLANDGVFTNADGKPLSNAMQLRVLGLMGVGLDFTQTTNTSALGASSGTSQLTPLQAVQKIFHDKVGWYPGANDPNSSAVKAWESYAASSFFTSDRSYEQGYAALEAAIIKDARTYDSTIPVGGIKSSSSGNAPTLAWMGSTGTSGVSSVTSTNSGAGSSKSSGTLSNKSAEPSTVSATNHAKAPTSSTPSSSGSGTSSGSGVASTNSSATTKSTGSTTPSYAVTSGTKKGSSNEEILAPTKSGTTPTTNRNDTYRADNPLLQTGSSSGSTDGKDVETMIQNMSLQNDEVISGMGNFGWGRQGSVMLGNDSRPVRMPSWFTIQPGWGDPNDYLPKLIPWFVVFDSPGSNYDHRVEVRNMRLLTKNKSDGKWVVWGSNDRADGNYYVQNSTFSNTDGPNNPGFQTEPSGGTSFDMRPGWLMHGWWTAGVISIDPTNIAAVHATIEARVQNWTPNDKYLMQVGADYYPAAGVAIGVMPGAGVARSRYITGEWKTYTMTTLTGGGISQEPGGGISIEEFRADPPPMD